MLYPCFKQPVVLYGPGWTPNFPLNKIDPHPHCISRDVLGKMFGYANVAFRKM